ncbi:MAG: PRC-barrel domain-containing protein [Candidatus Thermoplasmatota archaeon]|jgi:sporulation protein YlmC with PRC-barrel domain|nr:PRC-barrel domain-containing protein [Candidatus Thermoplasmatota archaeon]MCL5793801.1 PRC-barrel domain-containing protein [Candidatus Thermoplasmatota archaeon]
MEATLSQIAGKTIYNHQGIEIGTVSDVIIDFDRSLIYGLYVDETNGQLVENAAPISIPYRLIKAIGDVILLKGFPPFIRVGQPK